MSAPTPPRAVGSGWIGLRKTFDRRGASRRGGPLASESRWAWLFLAPTLLGLVLLSAAPILATFAISLTDWDLLRAPTFVGLDNYLGLLDNERFHLALRNTVFYVVASVPIGMTLALGLALALNQAIRGIAWIRTMYFLPLVTSAVAVGLVWAWIYSPTDGLLNQVLGLLGRPATEVDQRSVLGHAGDRRHERLAGPARPARSSSWPGSRRSRATTTRRPRWTARVGGRRSGGSRCRC